MDKAGKSSGVHAMGNGRMLVYGKGAELMRIQGPHYSLPSFAELVLSDKSAAAKSARERGNAAWVHSLTGVPAELRDYIDPSLPVFVRETDAGAAFDMKLTATNFCRTLYYEDYDIGALQHSCFLMIMRKGTEFFDGIATQEEYRLLVIGTGAVTLDADGKTIHVGPGRGRLLFAAGRTDEAVKHAEYALREDHIPAKLREWWRGWLDRGRQRRPAIPADHPQRETLEELFETVAVMIKSQQSADGGVIAGHVYPMAYVRDQAGVMRGLLEMGFWEDSRAILAFWMKKWRLYASLANADTMGTDAGRLVFSNDEVELPAYVLVCAAAYYRKTGDAVFLREIFPMLKWAFEVQLPHLAEGMTGFSGDETYIAGKTLPRRCIYQGSAESAMLFIVGGERFIGISEELSLLSDAKRVEYAQTLRTAREAYERNFVREGRLLANQPAREELASLPRFHYGFCERHEQLDQLVLAVMERGEDGYYQI